MFFHPKPVPSLFLASLTLLVTVTSTPLPVDAADAEVSLRQLTAKNFNTSIAHDTWYVSNALVGGAVVYQRETQISASYCLCISHIPSITPPTTS